VDDSVQEARNAEEKAKKAITDVCKWCYCTLMELLMNILLDLVGCYDGWGAEERAGH
jgi:hypothetical protein